MASDEEGSRRITGMLQPFNCRRWLAAIIFAGVVLSIVAAGGEMVVASSFFLDVLVNSVQQQQQRRRRESNYLVSLVKVRWVRWMEVG
ncbi:YALI0C01694p [Anopheles sinensis]|uniref:YALI0C01694p n=1 Tax=Anopheles sinensis TaxID=74873 RepID=A0A084WDP0_ANOSI|nr:YALI0C01694p [Anopheles sinensis]